MTIKTIVMRELTRSTYNMAMNMVKPSSEELVLQANGEILETQCKAINTNHIIFNWVMAHLVNDPERPFKSNRMLTIRIRMSGNCSTWRAPPTARRHTCRQISIEEQVKADLQLIALSHTREIATVLAADVVWM